MKKKLVGITLASALTITGFAGVVPGASAASPKPVYKATSTATPIYKASKFTLASLPRIVEFTTVVIKNENQAFTEFRKALEENVRATDIAAKEKHKALYEMAKSEREKILKDAELNLEKAKAQYNLEKVKNPGPAKQRLDAAYKRYDEARKTADFVTKQSLTRADKELENAQYRVKELFKRNERAIEDESKKAQLTTGKTEVENAIRLVQNYRNVKVSNIEDYYGKSQQEIGRINQEILENTFDIGRTQIQIEKVKYKLSDTEVNNRLRELDKVFRAEMNKVQEEARRAKEAEKELFNRFNKSYEESLKTLRYQLASLSTATK